MPRGLIATDQKKTYIQTLGRNENTKTRFLRNRSGLVERMWIPDEFGFDRGLEPVLFFGSALAWTMPDVFFVWRGGILGVQTNVGSIPKGRWATETVLVANPSDKGVSDIAKVYIRKPREQYAREYIMQILPSVSDKLAQYTKLWRE